MYDEGVYATNILILVDMQEGFLRGRHAEPLVGKIACMLESRPFDLVVATAFENEPDSMFDKVLDYHRLMTQKEREIVPELAPYVNRIVWKRGYGCVTPDFLRMMSDESGGTLQSHVFVCGVDTECCVLTIATQLFDAGIRPIVLSAYCESTSGNECHQAGLVCLRQLIGDRQVVDTEIATREELSGL